MLLANELLAEQFIRSFGNKFSLVARAFEFNRAGLALALTARDGGGAVGTAANDLVQGHLALVAIGKAHDDHAEVHQVGNDRKQRDFLTTMLRRCGREGATYFAVQGTASPQTAGWSRKLAICAGMRPKRVGVPTIMAS